MKSETHTGTLKKWQGDRGFGFIKPNAGGADVFLHISALRQAVRPPQVGDQISYRLSMQADGRVRAVNASIQGVALLPTRPAKSASSKPAPKPKRTGRQTVTGAIETIIGRRSLLPGADNTARSLGFAEFWVSLSVAGLGLDRCDHLLNLTQAGHGHLFLFQSSK